MFKKQSTLSQSEIDNLRRISWGMEGEREGDGEGPEREREKERHVLVGLFTCSTRSIYMH